MKINSVIKVLAIASMMAFGASSFAATDALSAGQKQQVETVVHDYLAKNPDVVIAALQSYQQRQMDQARKTIEKTQASLPQYANSLFHQTQDPTTGNPNAKVTVVEFFDYQCPHCVEMTPVLESVMKSNPDVRVVFKEFPIRGPASELAARAALAAKMQGKYFELHKALMAANRTLTEDDILKIAQSIGLNVDKLKTDMKSPTVEQQIKANYQLAQSLQLMGTPAFIVAKSNVTTTAPASAIIFIPGQVDEGQLKTAISKING